LRNPKKGVIFANVKRGRGRHDKNDGCKKKSVKNFSISKNFLTFANVTNKKERSKI